MRRALTLEIMFLHHTLKTFALRSTDHIDPIAWLKLSDVQIDVSFWRVSRETKLLYQSFRFGSGLLEFAEQRLRHARFFLRAEPHFDRRVTVVLCRNPA